jgi:predicted MFS family arabinose efflux permease
VEKLLPFFTLRFFGELANQLLQFAVPLMIYKSTGSIAWSGTAFFVEWLPRLFSFPLAGAAVDRFGPRIVYIIADSSRLFFSLIAYLGLFFFPKQTHLFLISLAVVNGFFFEQTFISIEQIICKFTPRADIHRAQSILTGIDQATTVAGPALAGLLVTIVKPSALLIMIALIFCTSLLFVLRMNIYHLRSQLGQDIYPFLTELRDGFKTLISIRRLVLIVCLTNILNLMIGLSLIISPAITTRVFGMPDEYLGIVYAISGAVGFIAIVVTPWLTDHFKLSRVGICAFFLTCIAFLCIGIAPSYWIYVAATSILMAMDGVFTVYIRTERAQLIPADQLGSTIGIIVFFNFISLPLAGLLIVISSSIIDFQALVVAVAIFGLILSIPLLNPLLKCES